MATKICTGCGAEYVASAQRCADCGGQLQFLRPGSAPAPRRSGSARVGVYLGDYREACRLRDVLAGREIDSVIEERHDVAVEGFHAVDVDGDHPGFHEVLVAPEDRALADEVREQLGLPADAVPEGQEFVDGRCPACGFVLPDEPGDSCPDCGLTLWAEDQDPAGSPDEDPGPPAAGWLPHF